MDDLICVGVLAGSFGVRGEVRLKSFTADPEAIADYNPLYSEDKTKSFDVALIRPVKGGFAVRVSGVLTKEQADELKGVKLFAPRDRLPSLPDDEYYHADLIGLDVYDTGGVHFGKVKSVMNHGAGDLLEIQGPNLKSSILLPFTLAVVPTVDLSSGRIIVDPPEGTL